MNPRNANFEHSFPQCSNCKETIVPDDLDLETMLCVECHHLKQAEAPCDHICPSCSFMTYDYNAMIEHIHFEEHIKHE